MNKLIDKIIIFIFCIAFYIPNVNNLQIVVPILVAIIFSALLSYIDNSTFKLTSFILFIIICIVDKEFLFFIPLICYDVLLIKVKWIWLFAFMPIILSINQVYYLSIIMIVLFIGVTYLLKYRTISLQKIQGEYYKLRDNSKEKSMMLEIKNKEFMEKQDYEINLATLNERNRIARDIHDNVGHMLSRSILQVGALLATSSEEKTKDNLGLIKETLTKAMDSIRDSVHDLHDNSIDLNTEIQTLISNFSFCTIELDYDIDSKLDNKLKYCFISVVKEALSNISTHSNATNATILLREHPALFQLVIEDNGIQGEYKSENGIGLKNILDRVTFFKGNLNISFDKGFKIFISIPKI